MLIVWVIIGIFMCGLAFLVHNKKMYDLISGYNTSSDEEKEAYQKNGYLRYMGGFLWGMALVWLVGIIFIATDIPYGMEIHLVIFLLYTMVGIIIGSKYSLNKKKKRRNLIITSSLTVAVLAFVGVLFYLGLKPTAVSFEDKSISFDGMYSYEIDYADIRHVELVEALPGGMRRTNGFGTSTRSLGHFSSDEFGKGRMYVYMEHSPYILMDTKKGFIIVNSKDAKETLEWYNLINEQLKES